MSSAMHELTSDLMEQRRYWVRETAIADAAHRYLRDTREAQPERYDEVEAEAWTQLVATLGRLGRPLAAARQ